ncbi:GGDEF domain-containing protein [Synechocystis salina LEGE 06155]|nr:GGDEF domain-containing protein [Synechocystis salina LEGE 06155]
MRNPFSDQSPLTVIMIDIDHFKQLNDRWGHQAGDVVLAKLSQLLSDHFRQSDLVCRYGGEEFLVILPDSNLTYACRRAEDFRNILNKQDMAENDPRIGCITASFGLASFLHQAKDDQELLQRADQALLAKEQGRDQVVVFDASSTTDAVGDS